VQGRGRYRADTEGANRRDRLIAAMKLSGHRTLYLGTLENPAGLPESRQTRDRLTDASGISQGDAQDTEGATP